MIRCECAAVCFCLWLFLCTLLFSSTWVAVSNSSDNYRIPTDDVYTHAKITNDINIFRSCLLSSSRRFCFYAVVHMCMCVLHELAIQIDDRTYFYFLGDTPRISFDQSLTGTGHRLHILNRDSVKRRHQSRNNNNNVKRNATIKPKIY